MNSLASETGLFPVLYSPHTPRTLGDNSGVEHPVQDPEDHKTNSQGSVLTLHVGKSLIRKSPSLPSLHPNYDLTPPHSILQAFWIHKQGFFSASAVKDDPCHAILNFFENFFPFSFNLEVVADEGKCLLLWGAQMNSGGRGSRGAV